MNDSEGFFGMANKKLRKKMSLKKPAPLERAPVKNENQIKNFDIQITSQVEAFLSIHFQIKHTKTYDAMR